MPDAVDRIAYAVGGAFVFPGLGTAELMLALLVALAFAASAVRTWLERQRGALSARSPLIWIVRRD